MKIVLIIVIVIIIVLLYFVFQNKFGTPQCDTVKGLFGQAKIYQLPYKPSHQAQKAGYKAYNPSVVKINDDYLYTYRVSNFTNCKTGGLFDAFSNVKISKPREGFESRLVIEYKSNNFDVVNAVGLEDVRPIVIGDNVILTGSMRTGVGGMSEMWMAELPVNMLELNGSDSIKLADMTKLTLDEYGKTRAEKNWMPFAQNDRLLFIYSINPHVIVECDKNGHSRKIATTSSDLVPKQIRGGGQVIEYNGEYLAMGHVRRTTNSYVTYFYTFSKDDNFRITSISKPFVFDDEYNRMKTNIQFASGLVINEETQTAVITYGEQDCDAKVCHIPLHAIIEVMQKIPAI